VTDIFREVDEDLRREQFKKLWAKYQGLVIGGALLIVLGVGGWRGYEWWQARLAAEAGTSFESAIMLSEAGKNAEAAAALEKIAQDGTPAYRELAALRQAAELAVTDPKAAIAAYRRVANDGGVEIILRELAALRAAALLIEESAFAEVRKLLQPMEAPGRFYRHSARELLAIAAWRSGDADGLKRLITTMLTDPETPLSTRSRIEVLVALSAAGDKG
jgi:hypothetical protein